MVLDQALNKYGEFSFTTDHKLPAACIGMYWGTSVMIRGEGKRPKEYLIWDGGDWNEQRYTHPTAGAHGDDHRSGPKPVSGRFQKAGELP
ncbi:hypothetical protein [Paenibacillus terrae]|uniref:Uncharacterized protein n=1 Tax=Paenibacillus terrae TaxID=159743 RepID=A0A0D7X4A6_9BACL|nr:hypothetical protein [Paenibacillus terrae]KJD46240.1 hypothetical protein QD47_07745 [Paenibacillus terrae]